MALSVGLIRTRYLGDMVLLIPTIREILSFDPDSRITIVANEGTTYPVERVPGVSILPMATSGKFKRFSSTLTVGRRLRSRSLDLLLDLTVSDRSRLITRLSRAHRKTAAGVASDRRLVDPWDSYVPVDLDQGPEHVIVQFSKALGHAGIVQRGNLDKYFDPSPEWVEQARCWKKLHLRQDRPLLFLHPGGRHWFKRWPPDRFGRLADLWVAKTQGKVIVAGTKAEETLIASVMTGMKNESTLPLMGAPVGLLDALIRSSTAFVGSDSAPLHLADAAHLPLVGLFGSTRPSVWGPTSSPKREIVYHALSCSPCHHIGCTLGDGNCMTGITVSTVFDRLERVLA